MADAEDDGNQSENKKDDVHPNSRGMPFSAMHQEFENKLSKGSSYAERVSIVLSGWDRLAGTASVGQLTFATFLYKWTLQLVLQGDWPKLEKIVKTRLKATLQRCCRDSTLEPMCKILLPLVTDPWGHPTLKSIIGGVEISDHDAEKYLEEETWEVIKVRIYTMVESRCEELALSVLKVCIRCIELRSTRDPEFALYLKQDHNHFVDLYFTLLYKYERNKFREELKNKDVEEGIDIVRRLLAQQEKAKVWKHRLKIAEIAVQIFLTSCIVKTFSGQFWSVFAVWCDVMLAIETSSDSLVEMVRTFIQLAESSQHIYTMASIFHHKFGEGHAALVTELLIRALTLDMNSLERVKHDKEESKDTEARLEHQMADGFMDLAAVFDRHEGVARECMLTAFSLHPTVMRLQKLEAYAKGTHVDLSGSAAVPSNLPKREEERAESEDGGNLSEVNEQSIKSESLLQNVSGNNLDDGCLIEPKPPEIKVDTGQPYDVNDRCGVRREESNFADGDLKENSRSGGLMDGGELQQEYSSQTIYDTKTESNSTEEFYSDDKFYDHFPDLKNKEDSLDAFRATTEGLIEQLNKDNITCAKENTNVDVLTAPHAVLNEDRLGITKELCDDLAVVLSSPRWQVLTWMLKKDELLSICEKYLRDSDSAKNITKELKYLNIDYSLFRHLPSEESHSNNGIEKGYEHFADDIDDSEPESLHLLNNDRPTQKRPYKTYSRRGRPPKLKSAGSDSDQYLQRRDYTTTSFSDSDSDFDPYGHHYGIKTEKGFEGKRVTAISSKDRCKRLKVDAATGRVRTSKGQVSQLRLYRHAFPSNESLTPDAQRIPSPRVDSPDIDSFNLFKDGAVRTYPSKISTSKPGNAPIKVEPCEYPEQTNADMERHLSNIDEHSAVSKTNNPQVALNAYNNNSHHHSNMNHLNRQDVISAPELKLNAQSNITGQSPISFNKMGGLHIRMQNSTKLKYVNSHGMQNHLRDHASMITPAVRVDSSKNTDLSSRIRPIMQINDTIAKNWKYSGYMVSNHNVANPAKNQTNVTNTPLSSTHVPNVKCSYRTKEGRVVNLNTHMGNQPKPLISNSNLITKEKGLQNPSEFEKSFTNFLLKQNEQIKDGKRPSVTITRRPLPSKSSLDSLEKQGTSVVYKKNNTMSALTNVQKNVLNRIMSPENSRTHFASGHLPVRAITMPVSHNPPNLPPDKGSPANLSRVLPKGTTVVRRPKSDAGAGPSGLNNGGTGMSVIRSQLSRSLSTPASRPTVSITPSSSFLISNSSDNYVGNSLPVRSNFIRTSVQSSPSVEDVNSLQQETFQAISGPSPPLASATVVGSVSQLLGNRINTLSNSPRETQGGSSVHSREVTLASGRTASYSRIQVSGVPTTTTVATLMGEPSRAPSMLETLLRDRSPTSPVVPVGSGNSVLNDLISLPETLVVSASPTAGVSNSNLSEAVNLATSHSSPPFSVACNVITIPTSSTSMVFSEIDSRPTVVNASTSNSSPVSTSLVGVNSMGVPVVGNISSSILPSSLSGSGIGSNIASQATVSTIASGTSSTNADSSGMHQVLLPAQLIQVQSSDGSTGLGIVHSGSLDLRLPPGTRVIKSSSGGIRSTAPVAISQPSSRQVNLLQNVKIVQNRQIVRTVVVPHSVALQSLGSQQSAQLVAISQNSNSSNNGIEIPSTSRIQPSQLHKMLGSNVVPGGLVIRAVRPPSSTAEVAVGESSTLKPLLQGAHAPHTQSVGQHEKEKDIEKPKVLQTPPQEEGLGERLTKHYIKAALLATTSTHSVGTQTQTTAVKPVTGQLVNQVMMNPMRGASSNALNTIPASGNVNTLSLTHTNAVSSETLEQLREFESVFEKVSNKSGKENESDTSQQTFNSSGISSEESMIAAQLLSMANETPVVTSASTFVSTVNTTSASENTHSLITASPNSTMTNAVNATSAVSSRIGDNTFITIPSTTQAGTLILVNPSVAASGLVTMGNTNPPSQPPPPASPALSSTSSHSSVASSPSSTSSKSKKTSSKPKVSPTTPIPSPSKPKSPPPPKVPPKPAVAKPQVEESDETKARIQAILDQYKQDLANNPQPQPAPRNRKNCPPPKNEGKSSSKKKSQIKKSDSGPTPSPQASDSSQLHSLSASPAPLATSVIGEDSEGSACSSSLSSSQFQEEKPKTEDNSSPQLIQGVVVSNVKVDNSSINPVATIPTGLAGGRVFQLIRHGNKVTAITTQHPYSKLKTGLAQGGPPPNVTIQGRINVNDLMENHIASLLTGNSTVNQGSSLIGKLLQSQQLQSSNVQQVVVQTSDQDGQSVVQQLSLQPVIASPSKLQLSSHATSTKVVITEPNSPLMNSPIKTAGTSQSSPIFPTGVATSPGTPHHRSTTPQTPASTPSPFPPQDDDTNSSEQSNDSTPAAPLPPFFTLTKQFMLPSQNQQFADKSLGESFSRSVSSQSSVMGSDRAQKESSLDSPTPGSYRLQSRHSFNETKMSVNEESFSESKNEQTINENNMLVHSNPNSPTIVKDNVLEMSPNSGPSSLENSPVVASQRVLSQGASSEVRSNSMDSVKSDLSVEEVQIPPSPATLTKQLQNAYMTEAALSPAVSQAQLSSNSAFSSPSTVQDLHFVERDLSPCISSTAQSFSLSDATSSVTTTLGNLNNVPGLSSTGSLEGSGLACLSSGDVYFDQAGVSLGLDALPLDEARTQSPSLSDLVPAVPLLSWSPRSADSLMGQSPSLNEALTGNIALGVHPSEDSLCDSSTGFPALFSIEGDGASVSSSTSDDLPSNTPNSASCTNVSIFNTPICSTPSPLNVLPEPSSSRRTYSRIIKENTNSREQDHTISSTHSEDLEEGEEADSVGLPEIASSNGNCNHSPATSSPIAGGHNWKFDVSDGNKSSDVPSEPEPESKDSNDLNAQEEQSSSESSSAPKERNSSQRRRSQRQIKTQEPKDNRAIPSHNGYQNQESEGTEVSVVKVLRSKKYSPPNPSSSRSSCIKTKNKDEISKFLEDEKPVEVQDNTTIKKEAKPDVAEELPTRFTRGSKRRSEGAPLQGDKKVKSENELKVEEDVKLPFEECDAAAPIRSLRNRNISGTSDSSSSYSIDRVSTPTLLDSPLGSCSGGTTNRKRRRRRVSHDSSISSRDGSPLTIIQATPQHDPSPSSNSGMNTRRASSRDHAKKTRCACCTDTQQQTPQSYSSSRRSSGRSSRGSGPSNS